MKAPRFSPAKAVALSITLIIGAFTLWSVIGAVVFNWRCGCAQPDFHPIQAGASFELQKQKTGLDNYNRPEESTYLTFPEWYLVFSPQEYAAFIGTQNPSRFPYFAAIAQFWNGYCEVYGLTKQHYVFNAGDHLMVTVIGASFTSEYAVKGLYENTIGRISEWTTSGERTTEDEYAARVAAAYGNFIPNDPWFEFPFFEKLVGVWTENSLWGPHLFRKCERKVFLSMEFGVKAAYGGLMSWASHLVFGVADTAVYASVESPDSVFRNSKIGKVKEAGDHSFIVTIPHYQGFTDLVPSLAREGLRFVDIAGNDEILLTMIAPSGWEYDLTDGVPLFSMNILTAPAFKRVAVQAPVLSLSSMIRAMDAKSLKIEHLYDY